MQAKGQVTVPKEAREELGLEPGAEVLWVKNPAGHWEIRTFDDLLEELTPVLEGVADWSRHVKKGYNPKRA